MTSPKMSDRRGHPEKQERHHVHRDPQRWEESVSERDSFLKARVVRDEADQEDLCLDFKTVQDSRDHITAAGL